MSSTFQSPGDGSPPRAVFKRLLQVPYGASIYPTRLGWRPLRDDPRFRELVTDPRNNDPLF